MVTLPDTLAVGTTLAVLPEIMCREKKMLQLQRQPQRSNNVLFYHLVYINDFCGFAQARSISMKHTFIVLSLSSCLVMFVSAGFEM